MSAADSVHVEGKEPLAIANFSPIDTASGLLPEIVASGEFRKGG
jgi:hypothetical protein